MESNVHTSKVILYILICVLTVTILFGCSGNKKDAIEVETITEDEIIQMYGGGNHITLTENNGSITGNCVMSTDGLVLNSLRERNKENIDNILKVNDYYLSSTDSEELSSIAYKDNVSVSYRFNDTTYEMCMSVNLAVGHTIKELIPFENEVASFTGYNVISINSFVNKAISSGNNVVATVITDNGAEMIEFHYNNEKDVKVLSVTIKKYVSA